MGELGWLVEHHRGSAEVFVAFVRPEGLDDGWVAQELWQAVERTAGVKALVDPEGREAALFGATTSGHVVLYDEAGRLVFSGGITASRGHAGDSLGRRTVAALLAGRPVALQAPAVYGCPLASTDRRGGGS